jgi:hypothetical protein
MGEFTQLRCEHCIPMENSLENHIAHQKVYTRLVVAFLPSLLTHFVAS